MDTTVPPQGVLIGPDEGRRPQLEGLVDRARAENVHKALRKAGIEVRG